MGKAVNKKKIVFVGVSGGVDSSVAAAMLKDQGHTVVGVFIRTWTPDFIECTWRDERRDAMRVCAHLGIPFLECDAEEAYKKGVADYMIEEYKKGNTPNPDVMCNREVKFGIFWQFARAHGADFIATGHYVQTRSCKLVQSPDESKDQSYFLWTLTQEDLSHTLFPIGHLQKTEVRKFAARYKLPTATKKDSQGVCFLGPLDMKEFLKHYISSEKGDVLDQNGDVIGQHDGAVFFTLGERHGFTITKHSTNDMPYYVIAKDIKKNTITVSSQAKEKESFFLRSGDLPRGPEKNDSFSGAYTIKLKNTNWISGLPIKDKKYTGQIRYHGEQLECTIEIGSTSNASIRFKNPTLVSPGQSIVIYDKDICLGGGVVV